MLPAQQFTSLRAFQDACIQSDQRITAAKLTTSEALKPENAPRNRYTNVLPWDSTRVQLRGGGSSYINANHVKCSASHFIATQGPLPSTCNEFFLMLQQQGVPLVVALGPAQEMGRVKFHPYWSHDSVSVKAERQWDGCAVTERTCQVVVDGHSHDFVHLHAYDWPDHGVPQDPSSIINVVKAVKLYAGAPVAVHCSAGIGRTGVICLAAHLTESVEQSRPKDEQCGLTSQMMVDGLLLLRDQRAGMVQTDLQFEFAGRVAQSIVDMSRASSQEQQHPPPPPNLLAQFWSRAEKKS